MLTGIRFGAGIPAASSAESSLARITPLFSGATEDDTVTLTDRGTSGPDIAFTQRAIKQFDTELLIVPVFQEPVPNGMNPERPDGKAKNPFETQQHLAQLNEITGNALQEAAELQGFIGGQGNSVEFDVPEPTGYPNLHVQKIVLLGVGQRGASVDVTTGSAAILGYRHEFLGSMLTRMLCNHDPKSVTVGIPNDSQRHTTQGAIPHLVKGVFDAQTPVSQLETVRFYEMGQIHESGDDLVGQGKPESTQRLFGDMLADAVARLWK